MGQSQESCIFCRIIRKEMGDIIYEDERTVVILDINPLATGHMLIIPKEHTTTMDQLPSSQLVGILGLIKKIVETTGLERYNILQNNRHIQSVDHVHFHLIPCWAGGAGSEKGALAIKWETIEQTEADRLAHGSYKALLGNLTTNKE
ncbi:hypothetical protein NEDG_01093 [Nematocida displodere]|uniref:HIT domain-containing protein n=1 Tax=Nematocida displodere TaxID=1805483 RepID=A0A177EAI8_9MICR|nr:hypothetical protein NEDG_01093 [Nematocida displodere]